MFQKFEKVQAQWLKQSDHLNNQCKRKSTKASLIMKSEDFRKKLEERQAIEVAKVLEDKYGNKAWQMKLRTPNSNKNKSKKISNFFQVGNPSLGLHMKILDREVGEVEVIRRPFSSYVQKTEKPDYHAVPVTEKSF